MCGRSEKEGQNWSWMMRDLQVKDIPWKNSMTQVINLILSILNIPDKICSAFN